MFFMLLLSVCLQVSTVEASLRLDSVASAGMGMSRSKMSAAIKGGLVLVNWKAATSGTTDVRRSGLQCHDTGGISFVCFLFALWLFSFS